MDSSYLKSTYMGNYETKKNYYMVRKRLINAYSMYISTVSGESQ